MCKTMNFVTKKDLFRGKNFLGEIGQLRYFSRNRTTKVQLLLIIINILLIILFNPLLYVNWR